MGQIRKFLKVSRKVQISNLLKCLSNAIIEHPEIQYRKRDQRPHRTDLIGIALQYGKTYGARRTDFEEIRNLTIGEIIDDSNKNFKD
jgi:hypothetical protein